jgi:sucrose-6-phosphate hydrolase SacC (GH32 family)
MDNDVLQHPHKQLYRTAFHYQPAKNWMNDPNGSATIDPDGIPFILYTG